MQSAFDTFWPPGVLAGPRGGTHESAHVGGQFVQPPMMRGEGGAGGARALAMAALPSSRICRQIILLAISETFWQVADSKLVGAPTSTYRVRITRVRRSSYRYTSTTSRLPTTGLEPPPRRSPHRTASANGARSSANGARSRLALALVLCAGGVAVRSCGQAAVHRRLETPMHMVDVDENLRLR